MNPEAVEWLESLVGWERIEHFHPPAGQVAGTLYTIKDDHECYNENRCRCDWGAAA